MKLIIILLFIITYAIGCSPMQSTLVIKSNKPDTEFWIDDEMVGRGMEVKLTVSGQAKSVDSADGRHRIVGKKYGYSEALVVIQPNKTRSKTFLFNFLVWTVGLFAAAPYWAYFAIDDYNYIPDDDQMEVNLQFND